MNDIDFDTLDIIIAVICVIIGIALLPAAMELAEPVTTSKHLVEKVVIISLVLGCVGAKRLFLPTRPKDPNVSVLIRMSFVFCAIGGTIASAVALAVGVTSEPSLLDVGLLASWQTIRYPAMIGVILLGVAFVMEFTLLRPRL